MHMLAAVCTTQHVPGFNSAPLSSWWFIHSLIPGMALRWFCYKFTRKQTKLAGVQILPELFWLSASRGEVRNHPGLQVMPSAQKVPQSHLSWVSGNVSWLALGFLGSQGEGLDHSNAHILPSVRVLSCWNSSGIITAPLEVSARAPQPRTHLALIWHLVGRVVLLHHLGSQHLEPPAELGEEQPIRIAWGAHGAVGGCATPGA